MPLRHSWHHVTALCIAEITAFEPHCEGFPGVAASTFGIQHLVFRLVVHRDVSSRLYSACSCGGLQVHSDLRVNVCETNDSVDLANLNFFPTLHYVHCQTTYSKCAKVDWFKNRKINLENTHKKKTRETATFFYKVSSACIHLTVTLSSNYYFSNHHDN